MNLDEARERSAQSMPHPTVIAAIDTRIASLGAVLVAAEIAAMNRAGLSVVHVHRPHTMWPSPVGVLPSHLWREVDEASAKALRTEVATLLDLFPHQEWSFTWLTGSPRRELARWMQHQRPLAVVVGRPRHIRPRVGASVATWLITQAGMPAVVAGV
jgi:nucleotide-binding universal stress UspA family protein